MFTAIHDGLLVLALVVVAAAATCFLPPGLGDGLCKGIVVVPNDFWLKWYFELEEEYSETRHVFFEATKDIFSFCHPLEDFLTVRLDLHQ